MAAGRIIYRNWIVELGRDPKRLRQAPLDEPSERIFSESDRRTDIGDTQTAGGLAEAIRRQELIQTEVRRALETLADQEREFVVCYYFLGHSYREISERSGRAVYKLEALHRRALRRLKRELRWLVHDLFGIKTPRRSRCPICDSPLRAQIDRLIAERDRLATWRPVIKELRDRYGLTVKSPQVLIGHEKYH